MFAGNYAPPEWLMCNGQTLPINENQALFTLIDITYGGDGKTSFNLPEGYTACHPAAALMR